MSTNSESRSGARSGRGKNQNPGADAPGDPNAGPGLTGYAGQPGRNRRTSPRIPAGWGRYLVAARPAPLLPPGAAMPDPLALPRLLAEDDQAMVLAEIPGPDGTGLSGRSPQHPLCPPVTVVAMPPHHAAELSANPALVCETDTPLICATANPLSATPI